MEVVERFYAECVSADAARWVNGVQTGKVNATSERTLRVLLDPAAPSSVADGFPEVFESYPVKVVRSGPIRPLSPTVS